MQTFGWASCAAGLLVLLGAQGEDAALKKEQKALQGPWKIVGLETPQGKDDKLDGAVLDFDKDGKTMSFTKDDKTQKATYKINPTGKPKEIDITISNGKVLEGVYQLEKDMLKICITHPDSNDGRPNEVAVKDGKSFILITFERAK